MHQDKTLMPDHIPPPPLPPTHPAPIANWLHTVGLFAILAFTTFAGHRQLLAIARHTSITTRYATSMLLEWILLAFIIVGIRQRKAFFLQAFHNKANTLAQSIGIGLAVYCLGFAAIALVAIPIHFTPLGRKTNEATVLAMLPHTPLQFLVWFGLSLTAGICEELIFRGYLTQQLTAWTRRPILAITIAALLFGSVHLYEGLAAILPLAALALVYGIVVRHLKGDLRSVIVAHTLQDFLVAMLALLRPTLEHFQSTH
jgi:membrane protease YdiL (CAAX protease family)